MSFIDSFSCCESADSPPGQKDACCHTKGFKVEPPTWNCEMVQNAGKLRYYSKMTLIHIAKVETIRLIFSDL